jgi:hypothetical protein
MTGGAIQIRRSNSDTEEMPLMDNECHARGMRAGEPEWLVGPAECEWLDVKDGVYKLDDPAKAEELVKDVGGFANAKTGGLLLVAFRTRKERGEELLAELRPVPRQCTSEARWMARRAFLLPVRQRLCTDLCTEPEVRHPNRPH